MENKPIVPQVEIVENGKIVPETRIDPAVAQFIMQASMTAQLVKMRKLEESKVPAGIKTIPTFTVRDTPTKIPLYPPWIAFSIINDGPVYGVKVEINSEEGLLDENLIQLDETYTFNAGYPVIRSLHLQAEAGGTAIVRIKGTVGRSI